MATIKSNSFVSKEQFPPEIKKTPFVPEEQNPPYVPEIKKSPYIPPSHTLSEIQEMIAIVDEFYLNLENKKRAASQQDFKSISDFNNYLQSGKEHKSGLDSWRRFLEK